MADDFFGLSKDTAEGLVRSHAGALAMLAMSTLATAATMAFFSKKNEGEHRYLQRRLDALESGLVLHVILDEQRFQELEANLATHARRDERRFTDLESLSSTSHPHSAPSRSSRRSSRRLRLLA